VVGENISAKVCGARMTTSLPPNTSSDFAYSVNFPSELKEQFEESFLVHTNFISLAEEHSLMGELEPHLKRHLYEKDHWDDAISMFRETERKQFNKLNSPIIKRLIDKSFPKTGKPSEVLPYTHILDLAAEGYIKPHVDSVRFCGDRVAVLSLLSSSVARFSMQSDPTTSLTAVVPRLSLYIMKGVSRYNFTHEILKDEESFHNTVHIPKTRRVSVICRNQP